MNNVEYKRKNRFIPLLIVGIIFFIFSAFMYYESLFRPVSGDIVHKIVNIPLGSSTQDIAKILHSDGLIKNEWFFILRVKVLKSEGKMQAGKYLLSSGMTTDEIIKKIVLGKAQIDSVKFTIPEGFTVKDIADRLSKIGLVNKEKFLSEAQNGIFNYDFLKGIPTNRPDRLEGYLFPDTYQIQLGASEDDIIKLMLSKFEEVYKSTIKNNVQKLGMSSDQIVIIASMIEKEAMVDSDRKLIAGVIYNRLKKNMKLQIDATVEYALGKHMDKLSYKDLEVNSPYNTYVNYGLPIGPISNPGIKSIEAALNPAKHDYYYYVAKNDGTHIFSKTYIEHLKAQNTVLSENK